MLKEATDIGRHYNLRFYKDVRIAKVNTSCPYNLFGVVPV